MLQRAEAFPRAAPNAAGARASSWSEALALAQQREDEKRRRDAKKDKAKASKANMLSEAPPPPPPGSIVGDPADQAAYWLFVEVCNSSTGHGPTPVHALLGLAAVSCCP